MKAGFTSKPDLFSSQQAILLLIWLIYLFFKSPFVSFHDSISYLADALGPFSWHTNATNHFLYNNTQHMLVRIFAFADPVGVLTIFSTLCSLITLVIITRFCRQIAGREAYFPAIILGLSFTFWQQSEIIEVYAFNTMLFAALLYLVLSARKDESAGRRLLAGLVYGLLILTHIQNILILPLFIWYQFFLTKRNAFSFLSFSIPLIFFAFLFIPPAILDLHPFRNIFFDSKFESNLFEFDLKDLGMQTLKLIGYLIWNFHLFLFFIIEGMIICWKEDRRRFYTLVIAGLPYGGFAWKYNVPDDYVFYLMAWVPLVIFSIWSLKYRLGRLKKATFTFAVALSMLLSPAAYAAGLLIARQVPQLRHLEAEKAYKGGLEYYFWPGKRNAPDPLAKARTLKAAGISPAEANVEWNYEAAHRYLEILEVKGKK